MDLIIFSGFHKKSNRGKATVHPNDVVSTPGQYVGDVVSTQGQSLGRLDEHELQSAKRNLNDTLSPMMKPQRSQQHNNPAMTTLKDSAGKFIFTPLQVYTQLIRRPRRQDSSTLGTMTVVISIQSTLTLDPAARLTMSL